MQKEFILTEDGSHTIFLPEMNEHYHSIHGAIQESMHVYIQEGLSSIRKPEISVLEIGFGTGLNAYLSFGVAKEMKIKLNYYSLEMYPLKPSEYAVLNYPDVIFRENGLVFEALHSADWESLREISPDFRIQKIKADLTHYDFSSLPQFDLVYYDAFAPVKQPEMWTDEVLVKVAKTVKSGGIFVTYCAKGTVRRALANSGFRMHRIPGPAGKKEMLKGIKEDQDIRG